VFGARGRWIAVGNRDDRAGDMSEKPVPLTDGLSEVYWQAASRQRLLIQHCLACGSYQFYPRSHCRSCLAPEPEWVQASGRGRLHTFSVVHRSTNPEFAEDCPYVFAIVELDEGVRLATRIVETAHDRLACDSAVEVAWPVIGADPPLPVFRMTPHDQEPG
jgi:uncharacterized protein